jgi:formylmethanofuran dehydrogenase subunit B
MNDNVLMTAMTAPMPGPGPAPWTCPFCPLLCDSFAVKAEPSGARLGLVGSDCARANAALARFGAAPANARAQINGRAVETDGAIAAAAALLANSRQPLFGGLGTDVAGARALYRLACETGAICDPANGRALMHGLRSLQDRGAFTTTLAEVRNRADLIVCMTGDPSARLPEFYRRCGLGEVGADGTAMARHVAVLRSLPAPGDHALPTGLAGITTEAIALHGDLFTTASVLAALVAGRVVRDAPAPLAALAARLLAARYAVIVWEGAVLPAHGALLAETINAIVGTLNRSTRAAAFPLGGGDGAATVNQVFAWLGGLPLRSRLGPLGLEHEPLRFDAQRLLADGAVDALLWVASFGTEPSPPAPLHLPRVVLAHPDTVLPAGPGDSVFIPVATPGIGSAGHLFRTDGVVLMPLSAVYADTLPTVADVVGRLTLAVQALRRQGAAA